MNSNKEKIPFFLDRIYRMDLIKNLVSPNKGKAHHFKSKLWGKAMQLKFLIVDTLGP